MPVKSDKWIRRMSLQHEMITPFVDTQVGKGVVSYGLSSYGYDMRISDEFQIFTNVHGSVIDPKNFDTKALVSVKADTIEIPPNSFVLARSVEYIRVPRNILCLALGKSTYARVGVVANFTPFEPEWEGHVTVELSNTTPCPVKIYANEGAFQVIFLESDEVCEVSYADRKGKYQAQQGITLAKVLGK